MDGWMDDGMDDYCITERTHERRMNKQLDEGRRQSGYRMHVANDNRWISNYVQLQLKDFKSVLNFNDAFSTFNALFALLFYQQKRLKRYKQFDIR